MHKRLHRNPEHFSRGSDLPPDVGGQRVRLQSGQKGGLAALVQQPGCKERAQEHLSMVLTTYKVDDSRTCKNCDLFRRQGCLSSITAASFCRIVKTKLSAKRDVVDKSTQTDIKKNAKAEACFFPLSHGLCFCRAIFGSEAPLPHIIPWCIVHPVRTYTFRTCPLSTLSRRRLLFRLGLVPELNRGGTLIHTP